MTKECDIEDPVKLKEDGNAAFKEGNFINALSCYTKAIKLTKEETLDKAVLYKNRAAVYLKQEQYEKAVKDCEKSLEIVPNDPKALFRRCQALEYLDRPEEAYRDARQIHTVDPTNKAIQPILARLHEIVQEKLRVNAQINNKVASMFEIAFDFEQTKDKRETAMNNILVLARESAGSSALVDAGVIQKIGSLLKVEKNNEIFLSGVRIVGELCKGSLQITKKVLLELGIPWFLDILNCSKEEQVNASQYCLQTILNSLSGLENKPDSTPDENLCEENKKEIDTLLTCLIYATTSRTMTGLGRDAIIQLIVRNVHYRGINWAETLIEIKGLQRLLEVASELQEYKYESAMEITEATRTITAVCLARIYENMYYDKARERYLEAVDDYIKSKLITPELESKIRVVVALTCLLLGPLDIGNTIIARDGMLEMILVMANSDDKLQQKVACECIIAAASKKDKVKTIISQGADILKKLYQSKDDSIRVRALVGLCKLGSMGGTDASIRPFADGSTTKLAEACRRFLINPSKDADMRRWAVEGLSYLTLDADVKEKLIDDKKALHAMLELAKSGNQACVYPTVTTLVNLCNAYEKQEVIPEMIELAKFAKHHIPEDHELDDPDFVSKRCVALAKEGITSALVVLSKTESENSKELISRVFNAICAERDLRGIVVQQGGAKVLFSMALEGTEKGRRHAAQALARIGITINPEVAFPGQKCVEVVRPLVMLLHPECNALESFEALMALCNLAGVNETVRKRIIKEGGVTRIEGYMFEEHLMLRRAATQCMTNMMLSPDVIKMYEGENDKTKFLLLLCGEEDEDTAEAAAGALAMLTSRALQEEEAAGTYNKITMLTAHDLSSQYYDILTDSYRANVSVSTTPLNSTERVLSLQSDSGVMSHWRDYQRLAVYTYLSHEAAAPFTLPSGATIQVPMVPQVGVFRRGRLHRLNCLAVQLPLESRRVHLILLLPDAPDGIDEVLVSLAKEKLLQMVRTLPQEETEVSLPQLAILTSDLDLGPFIRQLGIRQLFTDPHVNVRSIKQNAYFSTSFVAVNSVGSISTELEMKTSGRSKRETNKVVFNRPFLFFLVHSASDAILLSGAVQNPTQVPVPTHLSSS